MKVAFTVPGNPTGKGRPQFTKRGFAYTPEKTVTYENTVRVEYKRQARHRFPDDVPIYVFIQAYYPIPKSTSKKKLLDMINRILRPLKKCDVDNIAKIICDSLNEIAYGDDKQVVDLFVRKWYGEEPRVEVIISDEDLFGDIKI